MALRFAPGFGRASHARSGASCGVLRQRRPPPAAAAPGGGLQPLQARHLSRGGRIFAVQVSPSALLPSALRRLGVGPAVPRLGAPAADGARGLHATAVLSRRNNQGIPIQIAIRVFMELGWWLCKSGYFRVRAPFWALSGTGIQATHRHKTMTPLVPVSCSARQGPEDFSGVLRPPGAQNMT